MNIIRLIIVIIVLNLSSNAFSSAGVDVTNATVWDSLSRDLKLDHKTKLPIVQKEISRLVHDKERLNHILKASMPYIYYLHQTVQEKKLPAELALIPFIESEYNPNNYSETGALGLWQLMRNTARLLGVPVNYHYDGRKNIITSTNAALLHFSHLEKTFDGNWYLAIAAYNCGEGRVKYATRVAGSHSFWKIPIPRDTYYYTARLLAISEIVKNPKKYHVTLPTIQNKPYFTEVKSKQVVRLSELSKKIGVNIDVLKKLNPDTTAYYKAKSILVPIASSTLARQYLLKNYG